MDNEKQHFIPELYLKCWLDPLTPQGAYLWTISKSDQAAKRGSPRVICKDIDTYTKWGADGSRDIETENKLNDIETEYVKVKRGKIDNHLPLDNSDMISVANFLSSMYARTEVQRTDQKEMWNEILAEIDLGSSEEMASLQGTEIYSRMKEIENQPLSYHVENFTNLAAPYFQRMNYEILETSNPQGFITSDNPCFMIDLSILEKGLPESWDKVFTSPKFEIILPLSPKQLIRLKNTGSNSYINIDHTPEILDNLNKIITLNSSNVIISNQNTFKSDWFGEDAEA